MDEKTKKILIAIRSGSPYVNPIKDNSLIVPIESGKNDAKAQSLIQLIIDSVPEPPPSIPPLPEPPDKVIPQLEQSWIDRLKNVMLYTSMVNASSNTLNQYVNNVVIKYQETIDVQSSGASVINDLDGNGVGTNKFNQAYSLVSGEAIILIDSIIAEVQSILPLIPRILDPLNIESELILLMDHLDQLTLFNSLVDSKCAIETSLKIELQRAAEDNVLAMKSAQWATSEHTIELINATGSDALKEALKE